MNLVQWVGNRTTLIELRGFSPLILISQFATCSETCYSQFIDQSVRILYQESR